MTLLVAEEVDVVEGVAEFTTTFNVSDEELEEVFDVQDADYVYNNETFSTILEYVLEERAGIFYFERQEDYEPIFKIWKLRK